MQKEIKDNTLLKPAVRFSWIPIPPKSCPQATKWWWITQYGRKAVLPQFERGCVQCVHSKKCLTVKPIRQEITKYREQEHSNRIKDGDVLVQYNNFCEDNREAIMKEWGENNKVTEPEEKPVMYVSLTGATAILDVTPQMFRRFLKKYPGLITPPVKEGRELKFIESEIRMIKPDVNREMGTRHDYRGHFIAERAITEDIVCNGITYVTRYNAMKLLEVNTMQSIRNYVRMGDLHQTVVDFNGTPVQVVKKDELIKLKERLDQWKKKRKEPVQGLAAPAEPAVSLPPQEPVPVTETQEAVPTPVAGTVMDQFMKCLEEASGTRTGLFSGQPLGMLQILDQDLEAIREHGPSKEICIKFAADLIAYVQGLETREEK